MVYTIQTGSFLTQEAADKKFNALVRKLDGENLDYLRIEKIGKYYTVRLGKFKDRANAEVFFGPIKSRLSNAIIRDAYIKDNRIVRLHKVAQPVEKQAVKKKALPKVIKKLAKKKSSVKPLPPKTKPEAIKKPRKKIKPNHERMGDMHAGNGRYFMAIEEYRQVRSKRPVLRKKLAMILYKLGFVDEAIAEMESAVAFSPKKTDLRINLGVFYLAGEHVEKAKEQFFVSLEINPGNTLLYNYLGEIFLEAGEYDMAWFAAWMANRLGHKGQDLFNRLNSLSKAPYVYPWDNIEDELYVRLILVTTKDNAENIVSRISEGELFENIAAVESIGTNASVGGFIGHVSPAEIDYRIADAIIEREALSDPVIVKTDKGFHIAQRIIPFAYESWIKLLADYKLK